MGLFVVLMALIPKNRCPGANTVAKANAASLASFLHKHFTFSYGQRRHIGTKLIRYVALFAFNRALSSTRVYLTVGRLAFPPLPSGLLVDVPATTIPFIVGRELVFRMKPETAVPNK